MEEDTETNDKLDELVEYLEMEYWSWGTHPVVERANLDRFDNPEDKYNALRRKFNYVQGAMVGIGYALQKAYYKQGRDIEINFEMSAGWLDDVREKDRELREKIEGDTEE